MLEVRIKRGRKPRVRLKPSTRKRLEGGWDLANILARKNPVVDSIATGKDFVESTYKMAMGREPPDAFSELKKLPYHIRKAERSK